jgi:dethiobiotin synthetase
MQGVFITGTNTNVGKTYIGIALAKALRAENISVIPRKPIESGCKLVDGELIPEDAQALMLAAEYEGSLSEVCPYRFEPPISPVRAAHLANKVLTTEQLVNNCLEGSEDGFVLIEGAGGFYSPLSEDGLNADLAMALQLPVLLVAEDALGVLNQVLLNIEAIKIRGLNLVGVVLNQLEASKDERMDNAADLREHLDCPVFSTAYNSETAVTLPAAMMERILTQHDRRRAARMAS